MKSLPGGKPISKSGLVLAAAVAMYCEREQIDPLISRYAYAENHDHVVLVTAKDITGGA